MKLFVDVLSFCVLVLDVFLLLRGGAMGLRGLLLVKCDPAQMTAPCCVLAMKLGMLMLLLTVNYIT